MVQGDAGEAAEEESGVSADENPSAGGAGSSAAGPTPQPDALRQQQRYVAVGGSVVAGLAVTVSLFQRYPEFAPVWLLAGLLSGFAVYRLASGSVFPGAASSDDSANDDSDDPSETGEDDAAGADEDASTAAEEDEHGDTVEADSTESAA